MSKITTEGTNDLLFPDVVDYFKEKGLIQDKNDPILALVCHENGKITSAEFFVREKEGTKMYMITNENHAPYTCPFFTDKEPLEEYPSIPLFETKEDAERFMACGRKHGGILDDSLKIRSGKFLTISDEDE